MTPYYQDEAVTIYHGDCLAMLSDGVALQGIECVLTDPPYCSGAHESARRGKRPALTPESVTKRPIIEMDTFGVRAYEWMTRRWFMWARNLVVSGGHIACCTDWRMLPWVQLMLELAGWRLTNTLVWDKGYPGLGSGFRAQHELIALASNGPPRWHSYDFGNVIAATRLTQTEHPHEKPDDLLRPLIQTCTPAGGMILDPFMGSGSTLRAAKDLGRKAIGIEIEEHYCEIAAKRMAQEVLPLEALT